jgi:hypothetical protein
LTVAEEAGAEHALIEDAAFELLLAAAEKPECGYPEVKVTAVDSGEVIQRLSIARWLAPILEAIVDAPRVDPRGG